MKRVYVSCLLLSVLVMVGQLTVAQGDARKSSLYERLGGSEGIGKIFDEVGGRMAADPELAKFFQGQSQEALMAQRQKAVEFLAAKREARVLTADVRSSRRTVAWASPSHSGRLL